MADKKKRKKISQGPDKVTQPLVRHPTDTPTKWYQYQFDEKADSSSTEKPSKALIDSATYLLARDVDLFNQGRRKSRPSEANWLKTVAAGGTHADKSAALTLQLQESPVHGLGHLDMLLSAVHKKSSREAVQAMAQLKDVFLQDLLPPNRKLVPFASRPLNELDKLSAGSQQAKERRLILWQFEDSLKNKYAEFVRAIERLSNENIEAISSQAARIALDLLAACPEQEQFLLPLLVNKLGHPNYKVAAKVCNFLSILAQRQPNMRAVIVKEVERLIYRPNISQRAQFYGMCFLSQLMLRAGESELAVSLLNIYFSLFRILVNKGQMDNKIMSVMLAGTNRAFPYAKGNVEQLLAEIDTLYEVVAKSNFGTSLQTLKLLYQVLDASEGVSDRFYSALYRKLIDPNLHGSTHHPQLFNLLYKTLKSDSVDRRVKAFVKRLLQLALHETPAFAAAVLILIAKLVAERPAILRLSKSANKMAEETAVKLAQFDEMDDDEEKYTDVHDPDSEHDEDVKDDKSLAKKKTSTGSWVHRKNIAHRAGGSVYDTSIRNPLFAGADTTLEYELVLLASHHHPSVAVFAQNILNGARIGYDGDPLVDFSLMRFLDRFVFRNPKTKANKANAKDDRLKKVVKRKTYDPWGVKKLAINSEEYLKKGLNEIPVDERFLHRYATSTASGVGIKKNKEYDSDVESVNSDEFDQLLDRFEPGAKNDDFEVDFSSAFSSEKQSKKQKKKAKAADVDEDEEESPMSGEDDVDMDEEDEDGEGDEDGEDEDEDDEPEDDDDDDDEPEDDDDEDDDDNAGAKNFDFDDSDDDEGGLANVTDDALISADRFAEIMENEGEAAFDKLGKRKRKTRKPKGFKRHKK